MRSFLRSRCDYSTEAEIVAMIRRIDLDGDQCLTFSEFNQYMSGVCGPAPVVCVPEPASPVRNEKPLRAMSPIKTAESPKRPASAPRKEEPKSDLVLPSYVPRYYPYYSRYYPSYLPSYLDLPYYYRDSYYYRRYGYSYTPYDWYYPSSYYRRYYC